MSLLHEDHLGSLSRHSWQYHFANLFEQGQTHFGAYVCKFFFLSLPFFFVNIIEGFKLKTQVPGRHGKMYSFPVSHVFNHEIISDHIIEKINLILVLYFIWTLISNFNSDTGNHTNFLYLDFLIKIRA